MFLAAEEQVRGLEVERELSMWVAVGAAGEGAAGRGGGTEGAFNELGALGSGCLMWGFVTQSEVWILLRVLWDTVVRSKWWASCSSRAFTGTLRRNQLCVGFPWVPREQGVPSDCFLSREIYEGERLEELSGRHASC